jgi:hypothetical protein
MSGRALKVRLVFSVGQRTAAEGVFYLAGYEGELRILPPSSGDEVAFVLAQDDLLGLTDLRVVEQILQQVLGRKVWLLASIEDVTVPFE